MAPTEAHPILRQSLTPELRSIAIERTQSTLLTVVRPNLDTQYASKAPALTEFREAISTHGSSSDAVLVQDFRRWVPLSDYDTYKPFMALFEKRPCKEVELENLFSLGLPLFLASSSATSGKMSKLFPRYLSSLPDATPSLPTPRALVFSYGCDEVKEIEGEPGSAMKKIPVFPVTCGKVRASMGWTNMDNDESRMRLFVPGSVAPMAASMIKNHKSLLVVHALFALSRPDLAGIGTTFSTLFYDLLRHVDEEWDLLLSCIEHGTTPDLPSVREVESHLQAHLRASPERAIELREIGPPFSCEGWAARVWPKLESVLSICSGPFASVVPKLRSILGPTVVLRTPGYTSSESFIATAHRPDDLDALVLRSNNLVEFLDVTSEESHENICQAWELEVGKRYEVVLTTRDGLWRYRLDDTVDILGFDTNDGSPVFLHSGRRSLAIRLRSVLIGDNHLTVAVQAVGPDVLQINEFTTVLDERESTQTVGYLVELGGAPGPNAHLAPLRLSESLAAACTEYQTQLEISTVRHPTVRVVKPGTFAEYRQWKAERINAGPGQVKVPVALLDENAVGWILERVIQEL